MVLAAHPPSCHARRVFGRRENEKENERKREMGKGELKASRHFFLLIKYPFNSAWIGDFVANPFTKLQK